MLWLFSFFFLFNVNASTPNKVLKPKKTVISKPDQLKEALDKLQKTWDATRSYQTQFKQKVTSKLSKSTDVVEGTLSVMKPGKLRWEEVGTGNLQILNGKEVYLIQPNPIRKSRTVDIYTDVNKMLAQRALSFLTGEGKFETFYNVSLVTQAKDQLSLKFIPKDTKAQETLVAEIDKNSYFLRSLSSETVDSKVQLEFSTIRMNVALDETLFSYVPEPNDVVHKQ